jgi:tRNA pseudouridine55 synthase
MDDLLHHKKADAETPAARRRSQAGVVLNLYKRLGETPRERLERLRAAHKQYEHEVLSYAGRLDPMAEGVLLCLVGAANKRREAYLDLDKEYVLDVLFGFATDTYDILGRVMEMGEAEGLDRARVGKALNEFRGTIDQEYPPYSSKTVEGKSLFEWARGNALGSLVLPSRAVTVREITLEGLYKVPEQQLLAYIESSVEKVQGDFRQEEILRTWQRHLKKGGTRVFKAATVRIDCTSGTYARSIAHRLGQELGVPALALHILRTKAGEYNVEKSLK